MLDKKLEEYTGGDTYPFHMPGHKRLGPKMQEPYAYDITEIHGFDNLHDPQDEIAEINEKYSRLYGSKKSYILVGGSTCGILASIFAATEDEDSILIGRNSHVSVYNGATLRKLTVSYLYPEAKKGITLGVDPEDVRRALDIDRTIAAVVITSPTYEGYVSDIEKIAKTVHDHEAVLIVDSAHGAHLGFSEDFPKSAIAGGADLVVESLHKTLPALTQSAVLHVNNDKLVEKVERYLKIFQTSSPSYVLMASMAKCARFLESADFKSYKEKLDDFYFRTKALKNLYVLDEDPAIKDPGKLVIKSKVESVSGKKLMELLRNDYKLEMEMASFDYVIAMTSICDSSEGINRLAQALLEIDERITKDEFGKLKLKEDFFAISYPRAEKECELHEGVERGDGFIYIYPPGIPLVAPGEVKTKEIDLFLDMARQHNLDIKGDSPKNDI